LKNNHYFFRQKLLTPNLFVQKLADRQADVIGPKNDRPNCLPKSQLQKTDCEKPTREPRKGRETILLDFDFLHRIFILKN